MKYFYLALLAFVMLAGTASAQTAYYSTYSPYLEPCFRNNQIYIIYPRTYRTYRTYTYPVFNYPVIYANPRVSYNNRYKGPAYGFKEPATPVQPLEIINPFVKANNED